MNKESIIKAEKAENYYLKLIEEKQLELIWHPDRREECSIVFSSGEAIRAVYSSPEDTPMSCFREMNMFHLLLGDLRKDWNDDSWKLYAIKAVKYLRMLPVEIQIKNLEAYHCIVSGLYEEMGNEHKAQLHYEQALMYSTGLDFSFESENIMELLDKFQDNPQAQLEICMYILGFITADGVWTGYEHYDFWQREHYELVENILKHDVLQYVEEEEERPIYALIISCLKGIYYKRTQRFILAEKYFMEAIALSCEEYFINPLMLYTLLGQTYIGMNDMEKADSCFKKALDIDGSDADTLKSLILTYYDTPMEDEDFTELDEEYVRTFTEVCQEEIAFSPFVKKAIDDFFTPPEIYDEDEEENYDEEPNDQEYTFNDWYELAENGDVKAQLIVGHCYFTGTAVTQNYRIAREWFYLAALQGDAIAQLNLSFMYEHGIGMNIEKEEAEKWRWKSGHEATWRPDLINYALN